ncbi:MAG TPA: hypothetical protein VH092_05035, partial [Urbifossiella sp.]|nr:hypothetical protein [Urbifossiella sp.]
IESQLPELRQRLEAAGVTVQRFDVTTDPSGGGGSGGAAARDDGTARQTLPDTTPATAPTARATRSWYGGSSPASGLDVTV